MSVQDPVCGTCKSIQLAPGQTFVIRHDFPKALEPYYPLPAPGTKSIPVYRGNFDHEGSTYRGLLVIELEPTPNLVADGIREMNVPEDLTNLLRGREPAKWVSHDRLRIPKRKLPLPPKSARRATVDGAITGVTKHLTRLEAISIGDPNDLEHLTFSLFNGWYAEDGLNTCYAGNVYPGRIDTTLGEWQLRIEPRGDIHPQLLRSHQLKTGKSTITHVGRIRRDDGGRFSAPEAMALIELIETLASFALGRITAIVLPVGYRDGSAAWASWQCNRAVDRPGAFTPFLDQAHTAEQMTELFRAGYETSGDYLRWEVFHNALGYHFSAEHEATVNMQVLLPVSALQLISYAHLVTELPATDPNHLSDREWNDRGLGTVGQLRKLLGLVGVDMSIPGHLTRLAKVQTDIRDSTLPNPDALDCIIRLRNKVAHPKQKHAKKWSTEEWAETGFAATTMFNLAMLWWLGYDGRYLGKTSEYRGTGDSIFVPWHKP